MKNPLEPRNKPIRIKGPTPNTKSTILAVLGVVFVSPSDWIILEVDFFFDLFRGIFKIDSKNYSSRYK